MYLIGLSHLGFGELDKARDAFEQLLALEPNHMEVRQHLLRSASPGASHA
jgi:hypothetical protein